MEKPLCLMCSELRGPREHSQLCLVLHPGLAESWQRLRIEGVCWRGAGRAPRQPLRVYIYDLAGLFQP